MTLRTSQGQPEHRPRAAGHVRAIVLLTLAGLVTVFAAVQDRVTAAGARRYVLEYRGAAAVGMPPTIDSVMEDAVRRSVDQGLLWAGFVALVGCGAAAAVTRRSRRE